MLERVIGAMRTDQAKALQLINEGAAGFRELDLYPYCGNDEGLFTAHPELVGTSMRDLRDKRGNPLGSGCTRPRRRTRSAESPTSGRGQGRPRSSRRSLSSPASATRSARSATIGPAIAARRHCPRCAKKNAGAISP